MQSTEVRAAGALAGAALAGTGSFVRDMHAAIAERPFRVLGTVARPVRAAHDAISTTAYGAVAGALGAGPRVAGRALARITPPTARPMSSTVHGSVALAALNGAIGDLLSRSHNPLALDMTLRADGREVEPEASALARAYPDATAKLAVFVHGLCETDEAWDLQPLAQRERRRPSYGRQLRADLGHTPLYVRYNTGEHISDNALRLCDLLERVVAAWPTDVEEIVLVGHSMGGLVVRGACHIGDRRGARWARSARHVFCLGSPHLGAPLEKGANVAAYLLARLPETRPFARVLNGRSVGIKDLRFGSCAEADWCDCDIDEFLEDRCTDVPFLESATYYFVGATLARRPDGLAASLIGDLLVRFPSASGNGRRRRVPFELDNGRHFGRMSHFQLLNHAAVYGQIRSWLARTSDAAAAQRQSAAA